MELTANGYPHSVKPMIGNLLKIGQCGPGVPVFLQDRCSIRALGAKSVLVDDIPALLLEYRRRDPSNTACQLQMLEGEPNVLRLKHKPSTNVDATDLLIIPVKARLGLRKGGAVTLSVIPASKVRFLRPTPRRSPRPEARIQLWRTTSRSYPKCGLATAVSSRLA